VRIGLLAAKRSCPLDVWALIAPCLVGNLRAAFVEREAQLVDHLHHRQRRQRRILPPFGIFDE